MAGEPPTFQLQFFGSYYVMVNHAPLPSLRTQKGRWLLALLALRAGRPVEREWLAETLWPESDAAQGLYNLRRSLTNLRTALQKEAYRLEVPNTYTLSLNLTGATFDVAEFDMACAGPATVFNLDRALNLYRGPLLEGCQENWVFAERTDREEKLLWALQQRATLARGQGDVRTSISCLRRMLHQAPLQETPLRTLMNTLAETGDIAAALETYRTHRLLLHDRYQTDVSPETKNLYQSLLSERSERVRETGTTMPATEADKVSSSLTGIEPMGGALPVHSPLYIERDTDASFHSALNRRDSIILVKGPREVGKTSLLARGLARIREKKSNVIITDLQKFSREELESSNTFLQTLARQLADQLDLPAQPIADFGWRPNTGANENFERFVRRHILKPLSGHLFWALDEMDRLFTLDFATDIFALFRAWHNERAFDPNGSWQGLTLIFSYATEIHLFIADINQSPFNVGTRMELADFTEQEIEELNQKWENPIPNAIDRTRFHNLVGGHPLLVHSGLRAIAEGTVRLSELEMSGHSLETSIFSNHLRRLRMALEVDATLTKSIRSLLRPEPGRISLSVDSFYRLRAAGVLLGDTPRNARFRCNLYRDYLSNFLSE
jgi:DNA-binding SARP family transcriptional activator